MVGIRRSAKALGVTVGAALALGVLTYAALVLINLRDQPRSDLVRRMTQEYESRGHVADSRNAYIYLLGFAVPPDSNPLDIGIERRDWMEHAGPEFDESADPAADSYDYRSLRSNAVARLARICSDADADCYSALDSGTSTIDEWLATEAWLLQRYRGLIELAEFSEVAPIEMFAPIPSYSAALDGQRLLISDAWILAGRGDVKPLRLTLDQDLRFWRMILQNSDALITKMIATAAIVKHFKWGAAVLRRLPQELVADAMPGSWRSPITLAERSMRRCLRGEWMFANEISQSGGELMNYSGDTAWDAIRWKIMEPLMQPQDSSNRYAKMLSELVGLFDVPFESVPSSVSKAREIQRSTFRPYRNLYNLTGDIIYGANEWSVSSYAIRVADLEGVRRAAVLTADLRATGVLKENVAQSLMNSEIGGPYVNKPFQWYGKSGEIVFVGLEPGERGEHRFLY